MEKNISCFSASAFLVYKFSTTQESFSAGTVDKHSGIAHLLSYDRHQVKVFPGMLFSVVGALEHV